MVLNGKFEPKECTVFREKLIYFFYGRPAYKNGESTCIGMSGKAPVALLLTAGIISEAKRIFPFDTGAFVGNRYAQWMHPSMKWEHFEITELSDAPNKHVDAFFGSNGRYMDCLPEASRVVPEGEFEVEAIARMVADISSSGADDRRIAVEMLTENTIPFSNKHLKAIIGPHSLLAADWMKTFLGGSGSGVEYVSYSLNHLKRPVEYQALLEEKAKRLQQKWGYL
jgi:hypothetical protein